jgi:GH15 family glucan-1,4-alpha-glucosidase
LEVFFRVFGERRKMSGDAIRDYGVIGDGRSTALVSNCGSIDWLCWPRVDSPSVFAGILDPVKGGFWRIAPTRPFRSHRRYLEDSNVLVTTFETSEGTVTLTDLMPVFFERDKKKILIPEHEILRLVKCLDGRVELEVQFQPRANYGRTMAPMRSAAALGIRLEAGNHLYSFRSDCTVEIQAHNCAVARFYISAGESRHFSLTFDGDGPAVLPPLGAFSEQAVDRTNSWWRTWVDHCAYQGSYRTHVVRSLLALKLLCFAPSGAIVAARALSRAIRGVLHEI